MARPRKEGLDYFPHDVDASIDEKLEALETLHGVEGYAFYFKLLERIYRAGGFWRVSDAETPQIFGQKRMHWSTETCQERWQKLLDSCLKYGLFDIKAYEEEGVLTSDGIQERVFEVTRKRNKSRTKGFPASYSGRNPADNPTETPERKVKESKGKESRLIDEHTPEGIRELLKQDLGASEQEPKPSEQQPPQTSEECEYLTLAEQQLQTPAAQDWTNTNAFINIGRRPMKKYPEIFLTQGELAQAFRLWDGKIPRSEFWRVFQKALTRVRTHMRDGRKTADQIDSASWLTSFCYQDVLTELEKETRLQNQRAR